jgi:hypothetical protein
MAKDSSKGAEDVRPREEAGYGLADLPLDDPVALARLRFRYALGSAFLRLYSIALMMEAAGKTKH